MAGEERQEEGRVGAARGGDRRGHDRRKSDRRAPVPPWRRPWALVAYGAAGALVLMMLVLSAGGDEEPEPGDRADAGDSAAGRRGDVVAAPPPVQTAPPAARPGAASEAAYGTEDFERLILEGDKARGKVVRAQLYCDNPTTVLVVEGTDTVETAVAGLIDADRRIPAAECKWGRVNDPRREDFLLLIPPAMAGQFSSAPVVMDGYVRRRRLIADVEWVGKSRALAVRTAGVFRSLAEVPQS